LESAENADGGISENIADSLSSLSDSDNENELAINSKNLLSIPLRRNPRPDTNIGYASMSSNNNQQLINPAINSENSFHIERSNSISAKFFIKEDYDSSDLSSESFLSDEEYNQLHPLDKDIANKAY